MTRLTWNEVGSRNFSTGIDRGILFLQNGSGIPWNGIVSVNEAPSDIDVTENYIDGQKFFSFRKPGDYQATLEAYTYPLEFDEFDGQGRYITGQSRKRFSFSYRTLLGNDVDGLDRGYLIHLVYDAVASPSARNHTTITNDSSLNLFSWLITTANRKIADRVGSHLIIDSRIAYSWAMEAFEELLYGSASSDSRLPSPQEVYDIFEDASILKITDNGDGTWTAEAPDEILQMLGDDLFNITWPSVVYLNSDTYRVSSL